MTDISQHVNQIIEARQRLDLHETRLTKLETVTAVAAERNEHIQKSLDKIEASQSWLVRLVLGGIIMGVIAFLLKGGLNGPL